MKSSILCLLGSTSMALAAIRGFNHGAQGQNEASFASSFKMGTSLPGAEDFNSARLYTMIQEGTTDTPTQAIQAAIDTNTTLLLGLWASVDQNSFNNELAALASAISTYGDQFASLVVGISVGSEDLYRISTMGIAAGSGYGQSPDTLVAYIGQVREAIKGTSLSNKLIGHVDTWNVYVNESNAAVISACDWLGLDEYPYFQSTETNPISQAAFLFFQAYERVTAVAGGRPLWVTEAGWPVSGPTSNLAVASVENAAEFWQDVACELECRNINFWWYVLADPGTSPSFGITQNGTALYGLSCSDYTCGSSTNTINETSTNTSTNSNSSANSGSRTSSGSSATTSANPNTAAVTSIGSSVFALVMGLIVTSISL